MIASKLPSESFSRLGKTYPGTFIIDVEAEMFRSKSGTISEYCGGNLEIA